MAVIFAAPAGTGKTHHKEALKKYFNCNTVEDTGQDTTRKPGRKGLYVLVLCEPGAPAAKGSDRDRVLTRDEMNAAMVSVAGRCIWNADGSVNYPEGM